MSGFFLLALRNNLAILKPMYNFSPIHVEKDLDKWFEIACEAKLADPDKFYEAARIGRDLDSGQAFALKDNDGDIVAAVFIKRSLYDQNYSASLFALAVKPVLKNQGIGRILMREIETYLKAHDITQARLFTTGATGFYQKCGYEIFGQMDSEKGKPRFYLMKNF